MSVYRKYDKILEKILDFNHDDQESGGDEDFSKTFNDIESVVAREKVERFRNDIYDYVIVNDGESKYGIDDVMERMPMSITRICGDCVYVSPKMNYTEEEIDFNETYHFYEFSFLEGFCKMFGRKDVKFDTHYALSNGVDIADNKVSFPMINHSNVSKWFDVINSLEFFVSYSNKIYVVFDFEYINNYLNQRDITNFLVKIMKSVTHNLHDYNESPEKIHIFITVHNDNVEKRIELGIDPNAIVNELSTWMPNTKVLFDLDIRYTYRSNYETQSNTKIVLKSKDSGLNASKYKIEETSFITTYFECNTSNIEIYFSISGEVKIDDAEFSSFTTYSY